MRCANPLCCCDSPYLRNGSLYLLEMELAGDLVAESENKEFSMRMSPQRFFWLCSDCNKQFTLRRWTASGVVLALRNACAEQSDLPGEIPKSVATGRSPLRAAFLLRQQKSA